MNNELKHYGVLGMKWGIRRAEKRGENYSYKSSLQKKMQKKADKELKSGSGISRDTKVTLNAIKSRDAAFEKYARQTKTGHAIARNILMGPVGANSYHRIRSMGVGKGAAAIAGMMVHPAIVEVGTFVHELRKSDKKMQNKR